MSNESKAEHIPMLSREKRAAVIGLGFIGATYLVSFVALEHVDVFENSAQNSVRACAEALDAKPLNTSVVNIKCPSDIVKTSTTVNADGSQTLSNTYPSGESYIAASMAQAIETDQSLANTIGNNVMRAVGAGLVTAIPIVGFAGYVWVRTQPTLNRLNQTTS